MTLADHPIFVILAAAVAAPLLAELPVGRRVPVVVLEVLLGIVIGPHVLGLIRFDGFVPVMQTIGMAAVLFMAGMEMDFERIRGRPLSLALRGWAVSVGIALLAIALLHVVPEVHAPLMAAIALSSIKCRWWFELPAEWEGLRENHTDSAWRGRSGKFRNHPRVTNFGKLRSIQEAGHAGRIR